MKNLIDYKYYVVHAYTYMSMLVQFVIGEFDFFEGHHLF